MKKNRLFISAFLSVIAVLITCKYGECESTCFTCHEKAAFEGPVVHRPLFADQCNACHNPHVAKHKGLLQEQQPEICFSCHTDESTSFTSGIVHKPVSEGKCLSCHSPHTSNTKGLLIKKATDLCFSCHESISTEYKYSHQPFRKGDCSACHEPHNSENMLLLKNESDDLCVKCHTKSSVKNAHRNFPSEVRNCLSCHHPHGSSRKALVRNELHQPYEDKECDTCHAEGKISSQTCLECHEEITEQFQKTHSHMLYGRQNSCAICHSPHAGNTTKLLRGNLAGACRSCHEYTFQRHTEKLYTHNQVGECHKCHALHGADSPAMLAGDGNTICEQCHATQGQFTHPIGDKVLDPRTKMPMSCVTCHDPKGTDYKYQLKLSGQKALCVQCHHY